jgi:hypothetical protein
MGRYRVLAGIAIIVVIALFAIAPGVASAAPVAWGTPPSYGYGSCGCGYPSSNYSSYGYPSSSYPSYGYSNPSYGYPSSSYPSYGYSSYGWYHVQWGDTLSGIAAHYGVSVGYMQSINGIPNPHLIYAGSWLRVPAYPMPYPMPYSSYYGSGYSQSYGYMYSHKYYYKSYHHGY